MINKEDLTHYYKREKPLLISDLKKILNKYPENAVIRGYEGEHGVTIIIDNPNIGNDSEHYHLAIISTPEGY